ncbi:MAG TPA: hypothetical protein ENI23_00700 [bacterium]|nr:hypothetical protein [bacterium]
MSTFEFSAGRPRKTEWTLGQLLFLNGDAPIARALKSRIVGIKSRRNFRRFTFRVKSRETYSDPSGHLASVLFPSVNLRTITQGQNKSRTPSNERVLAWCLCPAWNWWGSAWSSTTNSYNLSRSQTISPDIRDPTNQNLICKHLVKVAQELEGRTFRGLIRQFKKLPPVTSADIRQMLPGLKAALDRYGHSAKEIKVFAETIDPVNYETLLEKHNLLVSSSKESTELFDYSNSDLGITLPADF